MPYRAEKPPLPETPEQLRARIPGWGADLDPADRPSYPRERTDLPTGAHWEFPERQEEPYPRERSIEHTELPPVFGTAQPLHGPAGAIRPDNPITQTGILAEPHAHPIASRRGRVDVRHQVLDPLIVAGPWIAGGL